MNDGIPARWSHRPALVQVLLALVACDGSDTGASSSTGAGGGSASSTSSSTGQGGAVEQAEPTRRGQLLVTRFTHTPEIHHEGALFGYFEADPVPPPPDPLPESDCEVLEAGPCIAFVCPLTEGGASEPRTFVDAGTVRVEGGLHVFEATADDRGQYVAGDDLDPFTPGTVLTISATGAAVPAFSGTVATPPSYEITSPIVGTERTVIDRTTDFDLTWTTGGTGVMHVSMQSEPWPGEPPEDQRWRDVQCTAPIEQGSLTVPREVLMMLEAGGQTVSLMARVEGETIAGDWRVSHDVIDMKWIFAELR
jgi:hypothetical protein